MNSTDKNNSKILHDRSLRRCVLSFDTETGPSRKSASRVWTLAIQCRHRQTASRALHSSLMATLPPFFPARARSAITPLPSLVSPALMSTGFFTRPRPYSGPASRPKEISCCSAPFLNPLMKTSCSACARREACEMATHPHHRSRCTSGGLAFARPSLRTKLLIAAQWSLTIVGIFCLIGVAVVIATTPEAWPL